MATEPSIDRRSPSSLTRRRGFTLVELLVVIAIIGILVGLLLPAVQSARAAARRLTCSSNSRQYALAIHNYHAAFNTLPAGSIKSPVTFYSWGMTAMLLPFMEEGAKFETIDFAAGSCNTHLLDLQARGAADPASNPINMLLCPSDFRSGEELLSGPTGPLPLSGDVGYLYPTNYLGLAGAGEDVDITNAYSACRGIIKGDGMFYTNKAVRFRDVLDGTSNTILFGERSLPRDLGWGWPLCGGDECEQYISAAAGFYMGNHKDAEYFLHLQHFWSWHEGGAHLTMADGSVHFMTYSLDYETFTHLATRAGSEQIDAAAWLP